MTKALIIGSISVLADTSELQRRSFNEAFADHDLNWTWDQPTYRKLLVSAGGRDRVANYAKARSEEVDADAIHHTKSERFVELLHNEPVTLRPEIRQAMTAAQKGGMRLAFASTTSAENVEALLAALRDEIGQDAFIAVTSRAMVEHSKPAPDVYELVLSLLDLRADEAVAIEDNLDGVLSARAAGVECLWLPNTNTMGHKPADAMHFDRWREQMNALAA